MHTMSTYVYVNLFKVCVLYEEKQGYTAKCMEKSVRMQFQHLQ